MAINVDMCLVHSNVSHDSHGMVMHQAASEVLTSCIAMKFGVAISDDKCLVHNNKFCW